ncbi:unnamed protein product [Penicillium olsonii]|nr:unnamed protein product [Penicillium olsonii]
MRCDFTLVFTHDARFTKFGVRDIDDKPYSCQYCSSCYKRRSVLSSSLNAPSPDNCFSDALRRHWQTCAGRIAAGDEIPRRTPSGKRKQVCDSCTSRKRACSTGLPCSECATRGGECTYYGVQRASRGGTCAEPQAQPLALQPGVESRVDECHAGDEESNLRVPPSRYPRLDFLINFTGATGLNEAYNYNGCDKVFSLADTDATEASGDIRCCENSASNPFISYLDDLETALYGDPNTSTVQEEIMSEKMMSLWNALQFQQDSSTHGQNHISVHEWLSFFSPASLTRYLSLFWDRWHRHCPILHKATFELNDCSLLLLATMALMGACMSSRDQHAAREMLDAAEELVFSNSLFSESSILRLKNKDQFPSREQLQILQATCFMCLLQKWEGSPEAKLRIQRQRFTTFVAVVRAIGLSKARHQSKSDVDWKSYIMEEELIRTFNHVFLLDSAFVIFHNSVPRMVLQEMTIDLTCAEDIFQASSREEFSNALKLHGSQFNRPLLTECVRNLCAETPDPAVIVALHKESPLNLFTIATATHGLIFHQLRAFAPLSLATAPLKLALDRWEVAWESSIEKRNDFKSSEIVPFFLRAREFATLARAYIDTSHLSPEDWKQVVKNIPGHTQPEMREGLATFDQTSMDQVAGLIRAVEVMKLDSN